jgi:hypothetical protein
MSLWPVVTQLHQWLAMANHSLEHILDGENNESQTNDARILLVLWFEIGYGVQDAEPSHHIKN